MKRRLLLALVLVAGLVAAPITSASAARTPIPGATRHASGLLVVPAIAPRHKHVPESSAQLLADMDSLAKRNPADLGYSWYDERTGQVVIGASTDAGARLATQRHSATQLTPYRVRRVSLSFGTLERIKHEVIGNPSLGPDSGAIYKTAPDREHGRVRVTLDRMSDALLNTLAARYGTDALTIEYNPNRPITELARQSDQSWYKGGAVIRAPKYTCTSGFPWLSGHEYMMVTAAHCGPEGGLVLTPAGATLGTIKKNDEENWNDGTGTVLMTNQSTYHGDIALIRTSLADRTVPYIYVGNSTSTQVAQVKEMWYRRGVSDDLFCTGGAVSGQQCDWFIDDCGIDTSSGIFGTGETDHNVCLGYSWDNEILLGDSGGPVYTVRPDGGIAAKGIINAKTWFFASPNGVVFTDIWDAWEGFPGVLNTPAINPGGDVDGDGMADLMGLFTNGNVVLYQSKGSINGTNTFDNNGVVTGTSWDNAVNLAQGDVDGDGKADVMGQFTNGNVMLYRNRGTVNGTNTFDNVGVLTGTGWGGATAITLGDVDGDGKADLIGLFNNGNVMLYRNKGTVNGTNTFDNIGVLTGTGWGGAVTLSLGDVNGDGKSDLAGLFNNGNVMVYRNRGSINGTNTFDNIGALVGTGWGGAVTLSLGDVNGDGRADLAGLFNGGNVMLYRSNGTINGFNTFDGNGVLVGTNWNFARKLVL